MAHRTKVGERHSRVAPAYAAWVNLLDYSAAVLPVTTVDKKIDVVEEEYKPISATDEEVWKSCKFLALDIEVGYVLMSSR